MFSESKVSLKILYSIILSPFEEKIKKKETIANTFIFLCLAINVTDIHHTSNNHIANNSNNFFSGKKWQNILLLLNLLLD